MPRRGGWLIFTRSVHRARLLSGRGSLARSRLIYHLADLYYYYIEGSRWRERGKDMKSDFIYQRGARSLGISHHHLFIFISDGDKSQLLLHHVLHSAALSFLCVLSLSLR